MVRLVFRPYTHVGRTICTSVPLRASTRVSPGFTLRRHSSPSFGSRRACSRSILHRGWWADAAALRLPARSLSLRMGVCHPSARMRVGLPSGFALTSSCSGIVHHLSGLKACARTPQQPESQSWVDAAPAVTSDNWVASQTLGVPLSLRLWISPIQ